MHLNDNIKKAEDQLYSICWVGSEITVATGGKRGVIHLFYCSKANQPNQNSATLIGHGDQIYDLKSTPQNQSLLFSSSSDYSVRVWDVDMKLCIMILAGDNGHLAPVLHIVLYF
jgi:polycomb protein EED